MRFPHIGDYVNYKPDIPSAGYNLSAAYSGYNTNQIIDESYDPTEWRVMEVDENRRITKLLGVPNSTQKPVSFGGSIGYNNSVLLLNSICASRYGNTILGATARSLNLEDIESKMNSNGIIARNANKGWKNQSIQYGTTKTYAKDKKYPVIYEYEKYSGINISDVTDGTQIITGNVNSMALAKMNPDGNIQSDNVYTIPITDTINFASESLTCAQTYYHFSQLNSYYDDADFYNMMFGTDANFWLASRSVGCESYCAVFGLSSIYHNDLGGQYLFYSFDGVDYRSNSLAPVITFESSIQVSSGIGTIEAPYEIEK